MKITGTLINYYFHCKRQCYLAGNRLNLEDNSELVKIGKALHESKLDGDKTEVSVENIKIDKIQGDYIVEYKKTNSDLIACQWQVYYYLYVLKNKGVIKKGKVICYEKVNQKPKSMELELTKEIEGQISILERDIIDLIEELVPPKAELKPICKKCAYYAYCFV